MSNAILGRLYHDQKNQTLCLEVRPHPESNKDIPVQTHTLLEDVKAISFSFYNPPVDPQKIVNPQTIGDSIPPFGWQADWKKGYYALPTVVKVIIERPLFFERREPIEFTYVIEEQNREINYY